MARLRRLRIAGLAALAGLGLSRPVRADLFPDAPFSDRAAGTTGAAFLKTPPSARADALGTSFAAAASGSEAVFWNPAGMARLEEAGLSEAAFNYNALLETSYGSAISFARPLADRRGVLGAGVVYHSQSALQGYDTLGDPSGDFKPNDLAVSLGYAKKLGAVYLGGAAKLIRSSLAGESGTTFAVDMGVQAERVTDVGEGALDLGAGVTNLGPAMRLGGVSDPLPFAFRAGALWHLSPRVNGLLDGHLPVDQDPYVSLGAEFNTPLGENAKASARGGFNTRNTRGIDGLTGMTAGLGLDLNVLRLDYAWVPLGDLGTTHRVSLALRF